MGQSAKWFLENSKADIICVDTWNISEEYYRDVVKAVGEVPEIFEYFKANLYEYRDRVLPIKSLTQGALIKIKESGVKIDLVYIDAGHTFQEVFNDIRACITLFPNAIITGDDYQWEEPSDMNDRSVKRALDEICKMYNYNYTVHSSGIGWLLNK